MLPTRRLLILMSASLALAALPAVVDAMLWPGVIAWWVALACASLWDIALLVRARPRVEVRAPAAVGVGDAASVTLQLVQARSAAATIRAETALPLEPGDDLEVLVPRGESEIALELRAPRRGMGRLVALWARIRGPLGLVCRVERIGVESREIAVVPNLSRVRKLLLDYFGASQQGAVVLPFRGEGTELDSLAAYAPGMDLGDVDWKVSARHQALRVRRNRLEKNQRVVVCIDTGRLMADPIEGLERLDHAVHAALVVSYAALRAGDLVGLHAYASEPLAFLPPIAGVKHVKRLTQACAALKTTDVETNHVLGLHDLLARLKRRSLVVVFTEFVDSTSAELVIESLGHLAQKHLVIFVALDDPITEAPISTEPGSAEDLAEAVVAGQLRDERARVLHKLKRLGVDVVTGTPGRATLDLLARYVRIKKRGLIG